MGGPQRRAEMQGVGRVPVGSLKECIVCKLCGGYYIDATTIVECLHTFCRSCIVKYLEKNKYCPVCDVQVHKTKPLLNIRPDKTLQDVVYKLVPKLYHNEMQRRKEFYTSHPEAEPLAHELQCEMTYQHILAPDETVCLALAHRGSEETPKRYLSCSAAVTVGHLKKLLRNKYDLSGTHKIEVMFEKDCLGDKLSMMDVAYIYSWKRKGPLDLRYQIYEQAAKKPKLDHPDSSLPESDKPDGPANDWKEVQLRISENGEMQAITGIQDNGLLDVVEHDSTNFKLKSETPTPPVSKSSQSPKNENSKKEMPGLKLISKITLPKGTDSGKTEEVKIMPKSPKSNKIESKVKKKIEKEVKKSEVEMSDIERKVESGLEVKSGKSKEEDSNSDKGAEEKKENSDIKVIWREESKTNNVQPSSAPSTSSLTSTQTSSSIPPTISSIKPSTPILSPTFTTLTPAPTTTVFSITNTKCTPKITDDQQPSVKKDDIPSPCVPINNNLVVEKNLKRKLEDSDSTASVVAPKHPKPTILNHSIGLLNLSNNHPLKKHSKMNRNGDNVTKESKNESKNEKNQIIVHKNVQITKPGGGNVPCYMPRGNVGPVINVPQPMKVEASKGSLKPTITLNASTSSPITQQNCGGLNNKTQQMKVKLPPAITSGYKTLREPPKTWNSQISKAQQQVAAAAAAAKNTAGSASKQADLKSVRPAKFFKGRNNMPRYLGNPASGVKPMYQVHVSPEKEKPPDGGTVQKLEKSEIRKHSIVKIDPKTLKPISEKAPETTSLSNVTSNLSTLVAPPSTMTDLKINTSSVSIFNPLKLQSSSPKGDRRSPKSPHSPKVKASSSVGTAPSQPSTPTPPHPSPPSSQSPTKRHQPALTFTPPNPFVPDLSSPTLGPAGPFGFPPYDPRMMAQAYNWLRYQHGPRGAFPAVFGVGLDMAAAQVAQAQAALSQAQKSGGGGRSEERSTASPKHSLPQQPPVSQPSVPSPQPSSSRTPQPPPASPKPPQKKPKDPSKPEKSIENAVEKLTQNKVKEMNLLSTKSEKETVRSGNGNASSSISACSKSSSSVTVDDKKKETDVVQKPTCPETEKSAESKENSKNSENTNNKSAESKSNEASKAPESDNKSKSVESADKASSEGSPKSQSSEPEKKSQESKSEEGDKSVSGDALKKGAVESGAEAGKTSAEI